MVNTQDFNNSFYRDIEMVRGDSLCFNFQLQGLGTQEKYEGLSVELKVAETYDDSPIIECSIDDGISILNYDSEKDVATFGVYVEPNKTKILEIERYYYDLEVSNTDNVITVLRGRFNVLYDIGG